MKLFYQDNGVEISGEGMQVADFLQRNPQFDFLKGYHLEEKITIEEDRKPNLDFLSVALSY